MLLLLSCCCSKVPLGVLLQRRSRLCSRSDCHEQPSLPAPAACRHYCRCCLPHLVTLAIKELLSVFPLPHQLSRAGPYVCGLLAVVQAAPRSVRDLRNTRVVALRPAPRRMMRLLMSMRLLSRYRPGGKYKTVAWSTASLMALSRACVSSVVPSPLAPYVTLRSADTGGDGMGSVPPMYPANE